MAESFVPSVREYAAHFQIDSPQSLIAEQVASGLVVRMAILYELLAAGDEGTEPAAGDGTGRPARIGQPA